MQVIIKDSPEQVADYGAKLVCDQIKQKPQSVLGLATGSTPVALYQNLIEAYQNNEVSFSDVSSFNLDEYLGLSPDHPQSYRYFMNEKLFNHIDIQLNKTAVPLGHHPDPMMACSHYEQAIVECGGIDLQLLGIGRNGHIGFNEPSSGLSSRTRIKTLTKETIDDNSRFFGKDEFQPHLSITMGIGTILDSKKILLIATGKDKADAIYQTVEGPISASCPASALQLHQDAIIVVDEEAAQKLEHKEFYRHVEFENSKLRKQLGLDSI